MTATMTPELSPAKPRRFGPRFFIALLLVLIAAMVVAWFAGLLQPQPTVALITNNADAFWDPVIRGAEDAAREHSVKLKVIKGNGTPDFQSNAVRSLIGQGVRGIGISPIDPAQQASVLREAAVRMPLVTFDSDCPDSSRLWFIGTDNYASGRQCGTLVRNAVPEGGEVLISVGSVTAENGLLRRQGVIDELLDRDTWGKERDPVDGALKGDKYTVVATCVDHHDKAKATQLVAEQIKAHPNLKCIVALYSYSAPAVLEALKQANALGKIKVVGFDVLPETLSAVESGELTATVQQAQYDFGFDSVRALATALHGGVGGMGSTPFRFFQARPVLKDDVAKVRQDLGGPAVDASEAK
jgi:ribose transport system substrate-binding protein